MNLRPGTTRQVAALAAAFAFGLAAGLPWGPAPARAAGGADLDIARGIDLMNAERHRDAVVHLERAVAEEPDSEEALFYAGVAFSRIGEYDRAAELLARALAVRESPEVVYELGRAHALAGRCADATAMFDRLPALGAGEGIVEVAATHLEGCRGAPRSGGVELALSVGVQADSNVILEPDNPVGPERDESDNRALLHLNATWNALRAGGASLVLGYEGYRSSHADLGDYDSLYHRLRPAVHLNAGGRVRPSAGFDLDYTLFDAGAYSRVGEAWVQVAVPTGSRARTEAFAARRWSAFWDTETFPENSVRSGDGWSAGLRQRLGRGRFQGMLTLEREQDDAREGHWSSAGWRAGGRVAVGLTGSLTLGLAGEYLARDYDEVFPGLGEAREDRLQTWTAALTWTLSRNLALTVSETWSRNDANLDAFAYTRNIAGVYLTLSAGR